MKRIESRSCNDSQRRRIHCNGEVGVESRAVGGVLGHTHVGLNARTERGDGDQETGVETYIWSMYMDLLSKTLLDRGRDPGVACLGHAEISTWYSCMVPCEL